MKKLFILSIILLLSSPVGAFHVYDLLAYTGKPDLSAYGMENIKIVYAWEMYNMTSAQWDTCIAADNCPDFTTPPNWREMQKVGGYSDALIVLDYEGLEAYEVASGTFRGNVIKMVEMVRQCKCVNLTSSFGFFGSPPIYDYGRITADPLGAEIKGDNNQLNSLVGHVDVLFPECYTRTTNMTEWTTACTNTIAEAKRIGGAKPVYVFLWPRYHSIVGPPNAGTLLSAVNWRTQLDLVLANADGIVIWDGNTGAWNGSAAWWVETLDFLADNGFYTP